MLYNYVGYNTYNDRPETWAEIRDVVRRGLGARLFPVGYEFTTYDSVNARYIVWVVRGHDHHIAADGRLVHTMTLETKYVLSNSSGSSISYQYDAKEAMYHTPDGLAAGVYNFGWRYETGSLVGGTYQFTLTQPVPAGGQIVIDISTSSPMTSATIATYPSIGSTTAIEDNVAIIRGAEGTSLGTISTSSTDKANLNCGARIIYGSNNYAQSAIRQLLNSGAEAGSVWQPTNKFDRAPSWANTAAGLMRGLPSDFLEVVQPAAIPFRTNSVFEVPSLDGTVYSHNQVYTLNDKFFLLSRPEIYGTWDSSSVKDGELLEYYNGLTDTERIKRDVNGTARYCWLRSPYPGYANYARGVITDGSLNSLNAYLSFGVAPACLIA